MNNTDPSVDTPQDANTQKHADFQEDTNTGNTPKQENDSATKQQWKEMKEERMNNDRDPALGAPQEANTDKHINFAEQDENSASTGVINEDEEESSTQQQWKEMKGMRKNNDRDPE